MVEFGEVEGVGWVLVVVGEFEGWCGFETGGVGEVDLAVVKDGSRVCIVG